MTAPFDFAPLLATGLPAPAAKWNGFPKYNFVGGHNDGEHVPVEALTAAATAVLTREGKTLATYGLQSGPQGYWPLREFLVAKLGRDAIGIPLDQDGMRMDAVAAALADLKQKNIRPKYIYTIPTVQNPTGTIMPEARRRELLRLAQQYDVPIFEDDCYADLIWNGQRPPALHAMSSRRDVIHVGSFSKSIAPALRVGYIIAEWDLIARMLAIKTDAGSGSLEQMVLAEFCSKHFTTHVPALTRGLRKKLETLMDALAEQFGTAAEFEDPKGGIFLWVKLPESVDTMKLYQAALAAGVALNPGPEWSVDKGYGKTRLRLCFANPSHEAIRAGVAALAEVCRKEFGVPER